jgi:serine-type D-Ala-D-Ala carboxypeptidase
MVLERALADSAFPGAYAVIGNSRGIIAEHGVGRIDWKESAPRPNAHTLWDLASLSKVVGMTSAIMQLVERNRVELDAPAQRYLPDWTGPGKERVTVRHLLTHTSGLPAFKQYYKEATTPAEARRLFFATPLDTAPGVRMVYSDIGAWLLGQIVERVSEQRLDRYLRANVFGPLRMTETRYRPPASLRARIAPTEIDPWRQRHLRGEVHDENAFALGGVSAHAGLFSTGYDLARLARMYLGGGTLEGRRFVARGTIGRFTRVQDTTISRRALGWETPTGSNSAGRYMGPHAFGHTGFTGTSMWMDPERDLFVILLTNRVNPTRQNGKISRVRVALADAVVQTVAAHGGKPATPSSLPR